MQFERRIEQFDARGHIHDLRAHVKRRYEGHRCRILLRLELDGQVKHVEREIAQVHV